MRKLLFILLTFNIAINGYSQSNLLDSLLKEYNYEKNDSSKISKLINIGTIFLNTNPDSSEYYFSKARELCDLMIKSDNPKTKEDGLFLYSKSLFKKALYKSLISDYVKAEELFLTVINKLTILINLSKNKTIISSSKIIKSNCFEGIADIYYEKGYYTIALKNYIEATRIRELLIKNGILKESEAAGQYFHLGMVHFELKNYKRALKNYTKCLEISKKFNYETGIAKSNNNIGLIYLELNKPKVAISYINQSLKYAKHTNNIILKAQAYDGLAECYISLKDFKQAELYLVKAIIIARKVGNKQGEIYILLGLANLYQKTNKYSKSILYCKKAIEISKNIGSIILEKNAYEQIFKTYDSKNDYKNALLYHKKFIALQDSVFSKEKNKQLEEAEAKFMANKKQKEIDNKNIELFKKDEHLKRKKLENYAFIFLTAILLIFIIIIFISLRSRKKKGILISEQNKKITDSIKYAKRIQNATLPTFKYLKQISKDFFIFYKPLQIVSGDFYWALKKGELTVFVVADCTGHGIPGAFVSMFGISLLNELILKSDLKKPHLILEEMRFVLKKSFKQTGKFKDQTDGIDIALSVINNQTNELYFASANQSAYLMRKSAITELIAVKNPVGIYPKEVLFKMQTINLEKDDIIYLFTDGYSDQFGGNSLKPKKFTEQRFKNLLSEIYTKPMKEQKEILELKFNEWKKGKKQIDDVLIFGIKY